MLQTTTLYKVIRVRHGEGMPCHGGNDAFRWPLPGAEPGNWAEAAGALALRMNGLHLTREPAAWWINEPDVRLFEAEYEGEILDDGGEKVCVRRARLVREVSWEVAQVYLEGEHQVSSGVTRASGSARVTASDSATVRAFGSATVRAFGSARVTASDSARVTAFGSATVISTHWHLDTALVALNQMAAHIDRRNGKLMFRSAVDRFESAAKP